ncbi:flagellar hook-length control protein FliK [uncultured Devosia sp.]|uniref:flagellar hook-length control protein FliK n=1 Tax=uncultured Devosia sp. TaxID=211434 RepID=UPI0035CC2936
MASHITVTSAALPGIPVKGLNAQPNAEAAPRDAFAALLDHATNAEPPVSKPSRTGAAEPADLEAGADTEQPPDQAPDAVAAAMPATLPIQPSATPPGQALLADTIDALVALRDALQAGETPKDLDAVNQGLDALADALGISLDQLPSLDELAALVAQPAAAGDTPQASLTAALAPLAYDLLTDPPTDANQADQLKTIGDKLAALLKGLDDGAIDADKLAALGLADDSVPDADLQAALAKLAKPAEIAPTIAPTFTAPTLETSEPALAGKAAATDTVDDTPAPQAADPVAKTDTATKVDSDPGDKPDPSKDKDAKPAAAPTVAQQPAGAGADPQAAALPANQTTRIEAVPGPRPVIAGYQTSQQQLNLPQIAFELVRQVNDGNSRFQMRLDPPELGKIDVRLDIDRSGQVTARLTVEKAETLDLMQRDQRGLEKALQQAGLDSAKTNLEFSLKQNSSGQQGQGNSSRLPLFDQGQPEIEDLPPPTITLYRASLSASGVNIIA